MIPTVLTIAGSDSSGAAGAQADLKTFEAYGVYGMSALTLVTAQNSVGITALQILPVEFITAQIDTVMTDIGATAIKTGMLLKAEVIRAVTEKLVEYTVTKAVIDPVLVAGDGRKLVDEEAESVYKESLFPRALIVTPNLVEAAILSGVRIARSGDMFTAAQVIHDLGPRFVLIKGGHLQDTPDQITDILYDGTSFEEFSVPRLQQTVNPRGIGCTYASAIAAGIAHGHPVPDAVRAAQQYVVNALRAAADWELGKGRGTVFHAFRTSG